MSRACKSSSPSFFTFIHLLTLPESYFCREYIESYFLKSPLHAKYINKKVLDKYYDVGGVRIEDDILVTDDGYENLTTVPKGEDMLKIINASS